MFDDDGLYIFKNGIEYRGSIKSSQNIQIEKYGFFEGNGRVNFIKKGIFVGKFQNDCANGLGRFENLDGKKLQEQIYSNLKIDDLILMLDQLLATQDN